MLLTFRQGIVQAPKNPSFLQENVKNINLRIFNTPIILTFADNSSDYIFMELKSVDSAWVGPFLQGNNYWLYWDLDINTAKRTFGYTIYPPIYSVVYPPLPKKDQHFFNTQTQEMNVYNGSSWQRKLRVFAGQIYNGKIISYDIGSQAKSYKKQYVGGILFDENDMPIMRSNGKFLTTQIQVSSSNNPSNTFNIETQQTYGRAIENIPKFHAVTWVGSNKLGIAQQINPYKGACIGIAIDDILFNEINRFITKGFITNENWNFTSVPGSPLFVGPNGEITTEVPNKISSQKIGKVINSNVAFIDIEKLYLINGPIVTPTLTTTATPSVTPTISISPTNTATPSVTVTNTVTPTLTPTNTVTPTLTPTNTVTPSVTISSSITVTPTITPTITSSMAITPTNTVTPTVTALPTITPSAS